MVEDASDSDSDERRREVDHDVSHDHEGATQNRSGPAEPTRDEGHSSPRSGDAPRTLPDERLERQRIPVDLAGGDDRLGEHDSDGDDERDPYAPEPSSARIVAGDPSLEATVFVFLGALAMILVMLRLSSILLG